MSLYGKEVGIPSNQVLLLEYLMRHPEGVRREEIIQRRFRQSRDPESALRQNIRRLRARLEGLVPLHEFIQTIDGGYRWNTLHEYRMFKHSRDVSTDLLLD
ncbi:helix-turn-helix domain-containing protein [Halalkalibacter wakoensis]|nr:helix-turn-helix domain-containing protein [Halalkalibacter wakoensis]